MRGNRITLHQYNYKTLVQKGIWNIQIWTRT